MGDRAAREPLLSAAEKTARLCHSAAFRIADAPAAESLARDLARITADHPFLAVGDAHDAGDLGGAAPRLWAEDVPGAAAGPLARRRRTAELHRPLAPGRAPLRAVLLRYADGAADLVLVAHRSRVGRASLGPLARSILTGAGLAVPPGGPHADLEELAGAVRDLRGDTPAWSDGHPGGAGHGVLRFPVPAPPDVPPADLHAVLVAAAGLVLARYAGTDRALVGTALSAAADGAVCAETLTVVPADAEAGTTIGRYLSGVRDRLAHGVPWEPSGDPALPDVLSARAGVLVARRDEDAYVPHLAPLYPLTLVVDLLPDGRVLGECHHRFGRDTAARFVRHTLHVAGRLLTGAPSSSLGEVELLDEAEKRRVARLGRPRHTVDAPAVCVHDALAARAAAHPDRVAVLGDGGSLTYRELDARAGRIAAGLRRRGVTTGARVGVCLDPSPDLIATMLGILRSGAAYVPLHPSYPAERITAILHDSDAALLVAMTERTVEEKAGDAAGDRARDVPVLTVEDLIAEGGDAPAGPVRVTPDDAAYVIYTSGSTGRPKGVKVPHRNVAALVAATERDFGLSPEDVWSFFHSPAFDFSVWEIWGCLLTGGRLVVVPYLVARSPASFHELLRRTGVTVLSQTPSALTHLIDHDHARPEPLAVRLVILGGEALDPRILLRWFDRHPEEECRVVNMYGITETTVHVTAQTVTRWDALTGSRSVGPPIPGWHVYVMDEAGRLLPPGVPGEIWVGGAGVADGYLNLPAVTAERFAADPFTGGRMYRSGDRGRLLPDGRLEHLGRLDDQVKLRGYRIEPEEIRAALLAVPAVTAAAVVLRRGPDSDSARLDAYVVAGDAAASGQDVRRRVARVLPDYMVPASVTVVAALPLTANGKLDVDRLAEVSTAAPAPVTPPAPVNGDVEEAVLAAWTAVLRTPVGPDDNFFDLGGNSLTAIRLLTVMAEHGLAELPPREIYLNPTVRGLAAVLRRQARPA
ncbi:hypothetical protein Skr01_49120 [Sphaerisporangium krabiense]|uniref:Amino acid adenylation domain-containing protein n=1 Tax=Sphaerisporangium krabiense TaxID=763782 RepID=A0A7W8Z227_9ACTN|nr:amino acid adenylation domain-containing protein [Sphaerisporangium krabiense]MBB5626022.1 amino acid adenylation domain-containing protein [Sphaerisporangium krabiense]GII64827.1 hypothetical protein Skr01_49120 [Sphaerisporangium krabiense]